MMTFRKLPLCLRSNKSQLLEVQVNPKPEKKKKKTQKALAAKMKATSLHKWLSGKLSTLAFEARTQFCSPGQAPPWWLYISHKEPPHPHSHVAVIFSGGTLREAGS